MSLAQPVPPDSTQPPAILLLARDEAEAMRTVLRVPVPHPPFLIVVRLTDVPTRLPRGTRIHVTSCWPRNETIINQLRVLHARHGLVDPTGLLGVETSTTQTVEVRKTRVVTDSVPVGAGLRSYQKQPAAKRAPQPTRRYNE